MDAEGIDHGAPGACPGQVALRWRGIAADPQPGYVGIGEPARRGRGRHLGSRLQDVTGESENGLAAAH